MTATPAPASVAVAAATATNLVLRVIVSPLSGADCCGATSTLLNLFIVPSLYLLFAAPGHVPLARRIKWRRTGP